MPTSSWPQQSLDQRWIGRLIVSLRLIPVTVTDTWPLFGPRIHFPLALHLPDSRRQHRLFLADIPWYAVPTTCRLVQQRVVRTTWTNQRAGDTSSGSQDDDMLWTNMVIPRVLQSYQKMCHLMREHFNLLRGTHYGRFGCAADE